MSTTPGDMTPADGRVALSRARVKSLATDVDEWLARRRSSDLLEQYATQLDTIEDILHRCTSALDAAIPAGGADLSGAYEACRTMDRRTVWVERVWRYFVDRFRQRDGSGSSAQCVRAADEIVWSCWRPAFATSAGEDRPLRPGPVPLPYLDAVHAPEAFPVGMVPADLSAVHADAPFVSEHLRRLPVPTVRIPGYAAAEPWQLALLAHESGHHLQFGADLVAPFREAVASAVRGAKGDDAAVDRWSNWSIELFADLASVALLGPWALWPIAELELRAPGQMDVAHGAYPPGAIRLRHLAAAISAAGLDPTDAWPAGWAGGVDADHLPDSRFVEPVVTAGLRVGPPGFDLLTWIGLRPRDFGPDGDCTQWRRWFGGGGQPNTPASLRAPRLVMAGAVAATADARRSSEPRRAQLLDAVHRHTFERVIALRAPERRAAVDHVPVGTDAGAQLATRLAHGDLPDVEHVG